MSANESDALRGFYKEFVDNEAGLDFVKKLAERELALDIQAFQAKTVEEKALAVERKRGLYDARTLLIEMSQPPIRQSK